MDVNMWIFVMNCDIARLQKEDEEDDDDGSGFVGMMATDYRRLYSCSGGAGNKKII